MPKDFGAPFDDHRADLILRTSDDVDFRVHKIILSLASPFFNDMLSLPKPALPQQGDMSRDGLHVITLSESSKALEIALHLVYPATSPMLRLDKLDDILAVLEFEKKYDTKFNVSFIEAGLKGALDKDPVGVYSISVAYGFFDVAKLAAIKSCRLPARSMTSRYLQQITSEQFFQLLSLRFEVDEALYELVKNSSWFVESIGSSRTAPSYCTTCWELHKRSGWLLHKRLINLIDLIYDALHQGLGIDNISTIKLPPWGPITCRSTENPRCRLSTSFGVQEFKKALVIAADSIFEKIDEKLSTKWFNGQVE